jgi:hypothetical protein
MSTEFEQAMAALATAERDISEGEERVRQQVMNLAKAHANGRDAQRAERLLGLLRANVTDWKGRRAAILRRIAHREANARPKDS